MRRLYEEVPPLIVPFDHSRAIVSQACLHDMISLKYRSHEFISLLLLSNLHWLKNPQRMEAMKGKIQEAMSLVVRTKTNQALLSSYSLHA